MRFSSFLCEKVDFAQKPGARDAEEGYTPGHRSRERKVEREKEREEGTKREREILHPCKDLVLVHADGLGQG